MISKKFVLIVAFFAVSSLAMDQKPKLNIKITLKKAADTTQPTIVPPVVQQSLPLATMRNTRNDFIVTDLNPIAYQIGFATRFYGEYHASLLDDGFVSFPMGSCDPLPLNTLENIRYFFTSAIPGHCNHLGSPIKVSDPTINSIVVVRGKDEGSGNRFEAYLGYNLNDFETSGRQRFYPAQLLALTTKSTKYVDEIHDCIFEPASRLDSAAVYRAYALPYILARAPFYTRDEVIFWNGTFCSNKVYWTQYENTLKGITYSSL